MLKFKFQLILLCITTIIISISQVHGHGMMLDPVSRSSRWRYDKSAPKNYDDNGLFCGGLDVQWHKNNGKCGLCGDNFSDLRPRPNELGGKYGQGIITKHYSQSQNAILGIKITTNHLGFFYFNICNLDTFKKESEDCFSANRIMFTDGNDKMYIGKKSGMIYPTIVLPKDLNCKHCVLRWNYQAGNNWGPCGNGTSALGCGPQENFKGCSDISISAKKVKTAHSKNMFNAIFKKNNYLDFIDFEPLQEMQQNEHLDNHLFESSNNAESNKNDAESDDDEKEEEKAVADFIEEKKLQEKEWPDFELYKYEFDNGEVANNALENGPSDFENIEEKDDIGTFAGVFEEMQQNLPLDNYLYKRFENKELINDD